MSTRTIQEFADRQQAAMLPAVVGALADGVTSETWPSIGTFVRTTLPLEAQVTFLKQVIERIKHDDCAGIREMRITVLRSKLYMQWLNDRPMQDLLMGRVS